MTTNLPLGELRDADLAELDWLAAQDDDGFLGYAPVGWPAETWVLHGMWEDPCPGDRARTLEERWREDNPGREGIGILAYESTLFPADPPDGWRRLRWRALADRLGEPLGDTAGDGDPVPPCFGWFPIHSWPETIQTPSEGNLDATTGERLVEVLAEHSVDGLETPCFCFYDILASPRRLERLVLTGPLRAVLDAARYGPRGTHTPDNIWPVDRSWLLWTEHDLWSTRVIGSPSLVAAIDSDPELETVSFTYCRPPAAESS